MSDFAAPISEEIWNKKYRFKDLSGTPVDEDVRATWRRVAHALSEPEEDAPEGRDHWERVFFEAMEDFKFLPAGRIISGAGTDRRVTLFNCLSAETPILTAQYGLVPIGTIAGEVVEVLDGDGAWVEAPINALGQQPVATVVLHGGYNGREVRTVRSTEGHRWVLSDGSEKTTGEIEGGECLKCVKRQNVADTPEYRAGVVHGIVYGDGSFERHDQKGRTFRVRLCGEKVELARFFDAALVAQTEPPSFGGDTLIRITGCGTDLKTLPVNVGVDYLTGFLRGWLATDGHVCKRDHRPILSCGEAEMGWLQRFGAVAGMESSYASILPDETNYGTRNKSIFNVSFSRWTMIEEDFLRTEHADAFGVAPTYPWVVSEVSEYGEPEPVFCPRVITTDSVQLHSGIHTGQCYVMGTIPDSMDGIFSALKEAALTMQQGGGIGYDFSPLRPKGAPVKKVAADASGPLTFMDVWDAMCRTVMSAGSRRGAMMATMRCDHPDIEAFIEAKSDPTRLRMFNMSVLVTDAFMEAVERDKTWQLAHEVRPGLPQDAPNTNAHGQRGDGKFVYRSVPARELWNKMMRSTYDYAEPGVIFIDRINADNNLKYCETISATNPCGEQPLPPYGACLLGSINLAALVRNPYGAKPGLDYAELEKLVRVAVRMMDNVNDVSLFPLEEQLAEAKAKRRIGLGVTGLADALLMCGIRYGTSEAVARAETWMTIIASAAYRASIDLAREKGPFPALDRAQYLTSGQFADRVLPSDMKREIMDVGIRNSHLLSIAPTGTISLYAGNISSGIEPIFAPAYTRKTLQDDGTRKEQRVVDYAVAVWEKEQEGSPEVLPDLPPAYVDAQSLLPSEHVAMQAAVQKWVDTSISKTVNVPEDISFEDFKAVYRMAYDSGCKGCTTYRPNEVTGSVIEIEKPEAKEEIPDDLLVSTAREFMNRDHDNIKRVKDKLEELGVSKVTELIAAGDPEGKEILFRWIQDQTWPEAPKEPEKEPENLIDKALRTTGINNVGNPISEAPQPRPEALDGTTYKIKIAENSLYVTVTDITDEAGTRPFEIFIISQNPEHQEWTTALTRMISAIFRRPHDSRFVVDELKQVFSAKGGGFWKGRYWPSTVAAIGRVIETHMEKIGYMEPGKDWQLSASDHKPGAIEEIDPLPGTAFDTCPKCFSTNMKNESGCMTCLDCGHSKCG